MFELKMPLSDAFAVSFIGIATVILILAVIAGLIILVSMLIRAIESAAGKKSVAAEAVSAEAPSGVPMPAGMNQGELELIGTDEKTAAIIMAIVSDKSGIPLNRLSFKSIKLMEDK